MAADAKDWSIPITSNPSDSGLETMPDNAKVARKIEYGGYAGIGSLSCSYELSDASTLTIEATPNSLIIGWCLNIPNLSSNSYKTLNCSTTLNPSDSSPCSWQDLVSGFRFHGFRGCDGSDPW